MEDLAVKLIITSGIILGGVIAKTAYEYGRYSAVHDIYKKGWVVVEVDETE